MWRISADHDSLYSFSSSYSTHYARVRDADSPSSSRYSTSSLEVPTSSSSSSSVLASLLPSSRSSGSSSSYGSSGSLQVLAPRLPMVEGSRAAMTALLIATRSWQWRRLASSTVSETERGAGGPERGRAAGAPKVQARMARTRKLRASEASADFSRQASDSEPGLVFSAPLLLCSE